MPLSDFKAPNHVTTCWTCRLPPKIRTELEQGWADGIRFAQMIRYLTGDPPKGVGLSRKEVNLISLQNHFYRDHHIGD